MAFLPEWQVEFIRLLYGLAFIILATVCFSMSRSAKIRLPWTWLGLFGVLHGLGNWALCFTVDNNVNITFSQIVAVMLAVSFICLAEFGRAGIVRALDRGPGVWIHMTLLLLAVPALIAGPGITQAILLHFLGLTGGLLAARALFLSSGDKEVPANKWLKTGSLIMGIYALCAGLTALPATSLSGLFNGDTYLNVFSFCCQGFGIFLILWLSVIAWSYSQAHFRENFDHSCLAARTRYAFLAAAILMIAICLGWTMTRHLENNARYNLQNESSSLVASLSDHIIDELDESDHAAMEIAGDDLIAAAFLSSEPRYIEGANLIIDRYQKVLEARVCYLVDLQGVVIASTNRNDPDSYIGYNYSFRPYFLQPMKGSAGRYFALGVTSGERGYYSSYPVRDSQHNIIGAVVIKISADTLEPTFQHHQLCFLTDPHGIIFLSSRQDMLFMSLRPLDEETRQALADSRQFGSGPFQTAGLHVSANKTDLFYQDEQYIQSGSNINNEGWSVVLLTPTGEMRAAWLPGLIMILFLSALINIFFLGMHQSIEDTALISASEENFRSIFNGVNEAIFVHESPGGRIVDINHKACEMYGLTREEILNGQMAVVANTPPYDAEKASQLIEKAAAGEAQLFDWIVKDSAGNRFWIDVNLKKVHLGGRKFVLAAARDINLRKQAEVAMQEHTVFLQSILDTIPYPVYYKNTDRIYQGCNKAFEEFAGRAKNEIIGKTAYDLFPENLASHYTGRDDDLFREPGVQVYETTVPYADGTKRDAIYNRITYTDSDGNIAGLLGVIIDITERKQWQEEMARLERLNLIGEMAAGIGHEIRNPMTTVRGLLQLLGSRNESVQNKKYYNVMIEELDRANAIISEFLSMAKDKSVSKKMLNLNSIVGALFPLIQADAMQTGKFIETDTADIPDLLLDEKEIRQLILNLVRNGLEAMQPGGKLTIKTYEAEQNVVLSVRDEGCGIEQDVLDKLGTPFCTTKDYGTGLGLAVCYSIAARHCATIKVETGLSGTTFCVSFNPEC
jgi:PAS domain S-box-containing protein